MSIQLVAVKVKEPISESKLMKMGFTLPSSSALAIISADFDLCDHCYETIVGKVEDLLSVRPKLLSIHDLKPLVVPPSSCEIAQDKRALVKLYVKAVNH